jgi:DnaK suppressor protein
MAKRAMKKAESKVYKERLLSLRARLRGDVTAMADSALKHEGHESARMPIHMADMGTDNFEQEFTLSLLASDEDTLGLIEAALERIEEGVYGVCQECETTIPKTRLNALPYTPFCVKCAARVQQMG